MNKHTLIGAVLLLSACGGAANEAERTVFRDSAGIRIAANISPDDSAAHVWWTVGEPELDIGGEDAVEPYVLHRVSSALRQPDGSIVVGLGGSADVRVFSADARHLRTTGRRGGGPGEFNTISSMFSGPGDSIYVFDLQARRLTLLDPAGNFVRVLPTQPEAGYTRIFGVFADGMLLGSLRPSEMAQPPQGGVSLMRVPVNLARFSTDGRLLDSLSSAPGSEGVVRVTMGANNQVSSIEVVRGGGFMKSPSYKAAGHEYYVGAQDNPEILVYDTSGTLRRIIRTGRAPEAVTQKHLDAMFEQQVSQAPPERQAAMKASGPPDTPHSDFVPPYGTLLVDRVANLWVSDYSDPLDREGRWTVYAPDGSVIARVQLPERFRPLDIGTDYILGRELDDLDVEHVRLYQIVK